MYDILNINIIEDILATQLFNENYTKIYEENRKVLLSYRFWRDENKLPSFKELPIIPVSIGNKKYTYLKKENKKFSDVSLKIERTKRAQKYFFEKLDAPLLVNNEYNSYDYEFLRDNVRRSEDYGDDNHIYMFYEDFYSFICLICVENITQYLLDEQFIFLFGDDEKKKYYPMDFKTEYDIDYKNMEPKDLRVDEIKRLVVQWQSPGYSGGTFLAQICDFHPQLLTVPEISLAEYDLLYEQVLKNKNVLAAYKVLIACTADNIKKLLNILLGVGSKNTPDPQKMFDIIASFYGTDYIPSKKEWFASIYLAYSMALNRKLNSRIVPAIFFSTHPISKAVKINRYYDIFREFKYLYGIEIIRRPSISLASWCDTVLSNTGWPQYNKYKIFMNEFLYRLKNFLCDMKTDDAEWVGSCFSDENHEFLFSRRLVRFEDLKKYPKATLKVMLCFLDLPYDEILMHTTENGIDVGHTSRPGETVKGYDVKPVYNLHEKGFSKFDHFRIELLLGNKYNVYGYEPLFSSEKYSIDDIIKMFEIKFKIEDHFALVDSNSMTAENRKALINLVKNALNASNGISSNGRKYVPIPMIEPSLEE